MVVKSHGPPMHFGEQSGEPLPFTLFSFRGQSTEALIGPGSVGTRLLAYVVPGLALLGIGVRYLFRQAFSDAVVPVAMEVIDA